MSLFESFNNSIKGADKTWTLMVFLKRVGIVKSYIKHNTNTLIDYSTKITRSNNKPKL